MHDACRNGRMPAAADFEQRSALLNRPMQAALHATEIALRRRAGHEEWTAVSAVERLAFVGVSAKVALAMNRRGLMAGNRRLGRSAASRPSCRIRLKFLVCAPTNKHAD
jgi:hypothetical protein